MYLNNAFLISPILTSQERQSRGHLQKIRRWEVNIKLEHREMACQEVNWWVSVTGSQSCETRICLGHFGIWRQDKRLIVKRWEPNIKWQSCQTPVEQKPPTTPPLWKPHKFQVSKYSTFSCGSMQSYTLPPTFFLQARTATQAKYIYCTAATNLYNVYTYSVIQAAWYHFTQTGTSMALRQFTVTENNEMYLGLHVKCSQFCMILTKFWFC